MDNTLMAPRKKRNEFGMAIAKSILENYQPKTVAEMQDTLKDIFGPMFEAMLQGEMDCTLVIQPMIMELRKLIIEEMVTLTRN